MMKVRLVRLCDHLMFAFVVILLIVLPSIHSDDLMQGTMSGKMFFSLYAMLIAGVLLAVKTVLKTPFCIHFSKIDGLLLIWTTYVLLNGLFQQMPISSRLLEFLGLIVFYIILRQIEPSNYGILLMAMLTGGVIQAFYGNMQLWGYYPSHHNVFRITGSFFNPGPFAGYLASVFPAIFGLCLFKFKIQPIRWSMISWIAGIALMTILLILIPTQSRASWMATGVSSVLLLMLRYPVIQWLKRCSLFKRGAMLLVLCIMMGVGLYGIFHLKTDSANGRLLVWKVTGKMIAERPIFGVGFDKFKAFYMTEQAKYFEKMPDSPEAMVAGDVNYAFNEFLQHAAENGLIGLALLLFVLTVAFRVSTKPFIELGWIAKAGIAGIVVFAFFSYPAQILPIKMSFFLYLSYLSSLAEKRTWQVQVMKYIPVKCVLALCATLALIGAIGYMDISRAAWKNWNLAYRLYSMRNYAGCLPQYEKALPVLKTDGDYLTNYGKALSMAGEHERSVAVLRQAASYYPNTIVYTALGDSYKLLGKPVEAEQAYLTAWYMNPSRFYSKYLLAKLYDETGQQEKARNIARELLTKEVKIESTAVNEIRKEMEKILGKYKD